jgi:hypothetical protein
MLIGFYNIKSKLKIIYFLLLVVFLIPTYFIHTKHYPDWGDDFAQYVYQAQQINTPSNIYKTVVNIDEYSSPKRSVFFSVVLSVVSPTLQIQNYVDVISITYILAGIVIFLFLSQYFTLSVSFIGTLAIFYNFLFLRLKSEVVPEFIFISLFYGVLFLISINKKWVKYLIPFLLGLIVSVRFVGLSLLLSYLVFIFFKKELTIKEKLKTIALTIGIFILVISFINVFFLTSIHNQEIGLYSNIMRNYFSSFYFFDNILVYSRYVLFFFEQEIPYWINPIIACFIVLFFIVGFISSIIKQKGILHFAFIFYLLFLFAYPNQTDIIKYLIPIIPLFFYFLIKGILVIENYIKCQYRNVLSILFLLIVFLSNSKTVWLQNNRVNSNILPYNQSVLNDFEKIKQIVDSSQNIAFGKPFVINLLADRHAYFLSNKNFEQVFMKANYVLSPKKKIKELYPKIEGIKITKGDTIELDNFFLTQIVR